MHAASSQSDFVAALLDPAATVPAGVTTMRGSPDAARFDVYRNNVMVSLITALEQKFPVSRKLVGDEFFKEMARGFIRQERPSSPLIFQYGDGFPEFIDGLEAARSVPYLGDVARLEVMWTRAYHAADATPLDIATIAGTDPEVLVGSGVVALPSASLLRSDWPVGSIWEAHQHDPVASGCPLGRRDDPRAASGRRCQGAHPAAAGWRFCRRSVCGQVARPRLRRQQPETKDSISAALSSVWHRWAQFFDCNLFQKVTIDGHDP